MVADRDFNSSAEGIGSVPGEDLVRSALMTTAPDLPLRL